MFPYAKLKKFCADSGYTEKAVRRKIEDAIWLEGRHYFKAPDGHIMIDLKGVEKWIKDGDGPLNPAIR